MEIVLGVAKDDGGDTGVDDHALAHHAGADVAHDGAVLRVDAGLIQRRAQHLIAGGGDDGVGFGMDRAAHLVALAAGDLQLFAHTKIQIGAVLTATGGAVVARCDDDVVLDDDGAVFFAQAGASLGDRLGDIKIIVVLRLLSGLHFLRPGYAV